MRTLQEVESQLGVAPDFRGARLQRANEPGTLQTCPTSLTGQTPRVSLGHGLSLEAVAHSRQRFGGNTLTALPREPLWKKFLAKFDEPIITILLAAALLSLFVDLLRIEPTISGIALGLVAVLVAAASIARRGEWVPALLFISAIVIFVIGLIVGHPCIEGLAVMIAVILATGVAFLSEYKSDREFELLNAQKKSVRVKLRRDGSIRSLSLEEVVGGDVVVLEAGDEVPADGRLFQANNLHVDQSLMTGESEPVRKLADTRDDTAAGPEQPGCVYRGTQVVEGTGVMIVTEVGDETYLGQIARRLSADADDDQAREGEEHRIKRKLTISREATPLQRKLEKLARLISRIGYLAAGSIFVALLARGLWIGEIGKDAGLLASAKALLDYFVYMVIIIVVALPEGLPMSVTVSLALAMRKMTRANSLVRQLVACETIGSATVICSDKTGTLTQNKMQVVHVWCGGSVHSSPLAPGGRGVGVRGLSMPPPNSELQWTGSPSMPRSMRPPSGRKKRRHDHRRQFDGGRLAPLAAGR